MIAEGVNVIPDEVSSVLSCNCKVAEPCKSVNCSCKSLKISCTPFCACYASTCQNEFTSDKALLCYESESDSEEAYFELVLDCHAYN